MKRHSLALEPSLNPIYLAGASKLPGSEACEMRLSIKRSSDVLREELSPSPLASGRALPFAAEANVRKLSLIRLQQPMCKHG